MEIVVGHRRGRGWTRLGHGLYVRGQNPTIVEQAQAWSLAFPARAAFTHLTAAQLRGWWQPGPTTHPIFVATRSGLAHPQRQGVQVSRLVEWPDADIVHGVRVATPAQSLLACCRDLGVLDLVQLGDCALRHGDCTIADLETATLTARPGVAKLRQLIPQLNERSESPWESVMRVLHHAAEIPVEPQKELFNDRGRFIARADLWIIGTNRINEYDGADHREREAHRRDLRRERDLISIGVDRCGYTAAELLHNGGDLITSADKLLGRPWDPERLRRWNALIDDSLFGQTGRARVAHRWKQE